MTGGTARKSPMTAIRVFMSTIVKDEGVEYSISEVFRVQLVGFVGLGLSVCLSKLMIIRVCVSKSLFESATQGAEVKINSLEMGNQRLRPMVRATRGHKCVPQ